MTKQTVQVLNKIGIHARPASMLVTAANRFESNVVISNGERTAVAKSMINLLALRAKMGDKVTIQAEGSDEKEAVEALVKLIQSKFDEE